MADDGYPLASLPDCHLLPIFKLWMQMRMAKFWTLRNRVTDLSLSKRMWSHSTRCRAYKLSKLTLGMSAGKAKQFTWKDARSVKNYASNRQYNYQRKSKQASVAVFREFFPTMMLYEYPSANFRRCFFAYGASKEEDRNLFNIWHKYDFRKMSELRTFTRRIHCD